MKFRYERWLVLWLLLFWSGAHAHEFWIEPTRFKITDADKIVANIRVGQYFKGNDYTFVPDKFVAFSITDSSGKRAVSGRLGDLPAVNEAPLRPGLQILTYHSTPTTLQYSDFEKFARFARKEGIAWVVDAHKRRGLPANSFTEAYTRYAKSLVQVGDVAGEDQPVGMPFELVAETNPYTAQPADDIWVKLLWRGQALADAQISVFRKPEGCQAGKSLVFTDADGRASIPRGAGGRFLLNAVHMIEPSAETASSNGAVWHSLWASLVFELPEVPTLIRDDADCPQPTKAKK